MWSVAARFRSPLLALLRRLLPRRVKRSLKKIWDPNRSISPREARIAAEMRGERSEAGSPAGAIPVVCLSIYDWTFRWQRPQQLMAGLAGRGHEVFYVSRTSAASRGAFAVRPLDVRVREVELSVPRPLEEAERNGTEQAFVDAALASLRALRDQHDLREALIVVQMPAWSAVALEAGRRFGWRVVYDCMDDWASFPGLGPCSAEEEPQLVADADAVVVSSEALLAKWSPVARRIRLVRNGADVAHFAGRPAAGERLLEKIPGPVIGYVGAVAEWFDVELLREVAAARPSYQFVLVGRASVPLDSLAVMPNVHFAGERPYEVLPAWVADFDVCLVPFRCGPLTAATDPVKVYEYLAAGKPVVSTPLPEAGRFSPHVRVAAGAASFAAAVDAELQSDDAAKSAARIAFAAGNSWEDRLDAFESVIREAHPKVSIVVVTWNHLEHTSLCLESVVLSTLHPNVEIVVVDNASTDGTLEWLRDFDFGAAALKVIPNAENRGFAAAVNQGIAAAEGSVLVLLNNDTLVPRGWLAGLLRHLRDPATGLVVPVTSFSGNESRIDVAYRDPAAMEEFAARRAREHEGRAFDIPVAAMYCLAMRRDVAQTIGPLDERFGAGMFEDDDYSHRVRLAGYRVLCAEDVFVHHFGEASFSSLGGEAYRELFESNRRKFEEKWQMPWQPHRTRPRLPG